MTNKEFRLFDAINSEGLDNSQWSIYDHMGAVSTKEFYGTLENVILKSGIWLSVYIDEDNRFQKATNIKPDYIAYYSENCWILFYYLSE